VSPLADAAAGEADVDDAEHLQAREDLTDAAVREGHLVGDLAEQHPATAVAQ
jgi:hypothetical protein